MSGDMSKIFVNCSAALWTCEYAEDISLVQRFHESLPGHDATPLVSLHSLAADLGIKAVYAKDESSRMGLPAFKILGASWGCFRAVAAKTNLPLDCTLEEISVAAQSAKLSLLAATSGNHGRAIARMAKLLGISATIIFPGYTTEQARKNVASEGAEIVVVDGDYDDAVVETVRRTGETEGALHVQDYSWPGYEEVARWVVEGYSTMLHEIEQKLHNEGLQATHLVTPIGAGTLGFAVVAHAKSQGRQTIVVTVEPDTSACLNHNLRQDRLETIPEVGTTIMTGMICGNVNQIAWNTLRRGVDVSVTITDPQCHEAVSWLHKNGINAGPCGASTLAGLREAIRLDLAATQLDEKSVVVLLVTEGTRSYEIPMH